MDTLNPANVFSRFEGLRGAGGTFFMLDQLQGDEPSLVHLGKVGAEDVESIHVVDIRCLTYEAGDVERVEVTTSNETIDGL